MPTRVELSDGILARLMELAARRGEPGLSALVEEAVRRYLDEEQGRRRRVDEARSVIGAMLEDDATELEESVRALRGPLR